MSFGKGIDSFTDIKNTNIRVVFLLQCSKQHKQQRSNSNFPDPEIFPALLFCIMVPSTDQMWDGSIITQYSACVIRDTAVFVKISCFSLENALPVGSKHCCVTLQDNVMM